MGVVLVDLREPIAEHLHRAANLGESCSRRHSSTYDNLHPPSFLGRGQRIGLRAVNRQKHQLALLAKFLEDAFYVSGAFGHFGDRQGNEIAAIERFGGLVHHLLPSCLVFHVFDHH